MPGGCGHEPGLADPGPKSGHGRAAPSCLRHLCLQRLACLLPRGVSMPTWGGASGSWAGSGGTGTCGPAP